MFVCCECCVLSGRGLCDGLISGGFCTVWMCEAYVIIWVWIWWYCYGVVVLNWL
jgi:hypothetical protein